MKSSLKMHFCQLRIKLIALLAAGLVQGAAMAACVGSEQVVAAARPAATVDTVKALRRIEPHFFGFNFVWVQFEDSLWNAASGQVEDEAIKWLRALPGAVYRYPGGTEANYFRWKTAVGPAAAREPRKAVKWKGPVATRFGLHEYLAFLRQVNGQPWYIANLYGDYGEEKDPGVLAAEAGQLAEYLNKHATGDGTMLRWELGNELDRGEYLWNETKYSAVARQVAEAIRRADPRARFVAIMEDFDAHWRWRRTNASEYNRKVAASLSDLASEFAQHNYYDGVNIELPFHVGNRIAQVCKSIEDAESVRSDAGKVKIWVTEHGRQPVKSAKKAEWKPTWPQSANLEAALAVADYMIAATQVPQIMGAFAHSLQGHDAPWPMFHKSTKTAQIQPSALYWALWVLRQGLEADVLRTRTESANAGGYFGGYDFRATVMANPERTRWTLWAVNRSPRAQMIELRIPALAGRRAKAKLQVLADVNLHANNYIDGNRLRPREEPEIEIVFDPKGVASMQLSSQSITSARLSFH